MSEKFLKQLKVELRLEVVGVEITAEQLIRLEEGNALAIPSVLFGEKSVLRLGEEIVARGCLRTHENNLVFEVVEKGEALQQKSCTEQLIAD